nr:site-specific DNA-methyltransferase [Bacteroidaceae bacterium]
YLKALVEKQPDGKCGITYREKSRKLSTIDFVENTFSNDIAKKEVAGFDLAMKFDYPKPTSLIIDLIESHKNKNATCLDFFAGSGSTGDAVLKLNFKDNGQRHYILVQDANDGVCKTVTYMRNKKIIEGYGERPPLGNSLKYYRTAFVGSNTSDKATDDDRTVLAQKAGCLLALAENTLYEQKKTENYQIFKDKDKDVWTAVYFTEDNRSNVFMPFVNDVRALQGIKNVYIFSWGDVSSYEAYFGNVDNLSLKSIPQPILDIYKSLNS